MPGVPRGFERFPSGPLSVAGWLMMLVLVMLAPGRAGWAQSAPPPAAPAAVPANWDVFARKGCATCHRIRGIGNGVGGPDLARISSGTGFFDIAAAMWNHVPQMRAKMLTKRVEWPRLTPQELSDVIEFLFMMQRPDIPPHLGAGERLFVAKGCARCHATRGNSERGGPRLEEIARSTSSVLMAAAMWNHASRLSEVMDADGTVHAPFAGTEVEDIVAYVLAAGRDPRGEMTPVLVGVPDRGKRLFADKGCARCHVVGDKGSGGKIPLVPRESRATLTELPGALWNHAPAIRALGVRLPNVTGQDMADISSYLHASYYFDPPHGDTRRGQRLVENNCLRCHAIYNKGAGVAPNFATSNVVSSQLGQLAAMWNHGRQMENLANRRSVVLPTLTGQELGDITSYLAGLGSGAPKTR